MICRLELYLQREYILSEEVELSENNADTGDYMQDFDINAKTREIELQAAIEKMKLNHLRPIIKSGYDYTIVPVFQSKMNYQSIIDIHE